MKKRIFEIKVRFSEEELTALTERAKECGYSREAYIRSVLNARIPRPMPPPDYHSLIRELHGIGNNLNQIAQKAHTLNVVDAGRYAAALQMFAEVVARIEKAVIVPVKME